MAEINCRQLRVAQAQGTKDCNRRELALEIGAHAVEDTEAADKQRAEADEQQARTNLIQDLAHAAAAVRKGLYFEIRLRKSGGNCVTPLVRVAVDLHPVLILEPAARLHQSGRVQRLRGDQHRRSAPVGAQSPVGLAPDQRPHLHRQKSDLYSVADVQIQSRGEHRIDGSTEHAVPCCDRVGHRHSRVELDFAVKRVVLVDALQLHQLRLPAGQHHGAQLDEQRYLAVPSHPVENFTGKRSSILHLDVAAEQGAAIGQQTLAHLLEQTSAGGNQHHPQHETRPENPQVPAAGAKVAPGEASDEAHENRDPVSPHSPSGRRRGASARGHSFAPAPDRA